MSKNTAPTPQPATPEPWEAREFAMRLSEYGVAMFHMQGEKARVLAEVLKSMYALRATPVAASEPVPSERAIETAKRFVSHPDVVRELAALLSATPEPAPWGAIDYSPIYEFAQRHRVPYNELCATVRASMRSAFLATPVEAAEPWKVACPHCLRKGDFNEKDACGVDHGRA